MIKEKLVGIVIPIYQQLSDEENIVLKQYLNVFYRRDIFFVMPENLDIQVFEQSVREHPKFNDCKIQKLKQQFFDSTISYSFLLTRPEFYGLFTDYKYILITQLDAYCWYDYLDFWCKLDYDYIGAPWCDRCPVRCDPAQNTNLDKVGNGGFSLRKVKTFIEQLQNTPLYVFHPEDVYITRQLKLNLPRCDIAAWFSVESCAALHILKRGIRPMGCHQLKNLTSQRNYLIIQSVMNTFIKQGQELQN